MTTQQDLQQCLYQEQATKLVWKSITLQQQAMILLKQATSLDIQATALLTDRSGLQQQTNHQGSRNPEAEGGVPIVSSWRDQDDDWETWVAAHFVFAGDA